MSEDPPAPSPSTPSTPADPPRSRELGGWERALAGFVGFIGVGGGGAGVFLSDNQAGTTAILLLGAVFLIMAVQGTAILKITKEGGDFAARQAHRKGRELLYRAEDAVEDGDAEEAAALVEEAKVLAPRLSHDRQLRRVADSAFELQLFEAIDMVIHDRFSDRLTLETNYCANGQWRADGVIYPHKRPEQKLIVEIAATGVELTGYFTNQVKGREFTSPVLVVTRSLRSRVDRIDRLNTLRPGKLRTVIWDGSADNGRLGDEIELLTREFLTD